MTPTLSTLVPRALRGLATRSLLLTALVSLPAWAAPPFTVNGNGTVTDGATGLVWDQCPYGLTGATCSTGTALQTNWAGALNAAVAANAANYKGFNAWRLPNVTELESIVKLDTYTPGQAAIDSTVFPNTPTDSFICSGGCTWTSTTSVSGPSKAWIVRFDNGYTIADNKSQTYYVRLVRSGQSLAPFDSLAPAYADLSITKTDGVTTVTPGASVTYTITASNAGPNDAPGTLVADTLPATLTGATWTCVGAGGGICTASGSGDLNDTVNLPAGSSVTYTLTATVSPAATGALSNTATVYSAVADPNPANNSATDSDTLTSLADLSITKTDGVTTVNPGASLTYTITASNAGPSNAPGTNVADTLPAALTGATWTCVGAGGGTCTASGSGNLNDTVSLPAGGSVTYTLTATVSGAATGTLSNTATVAAAGGITDPTPGNNSATDSDTVNVQADLLITKTDGVTTAVPGGSVTYTIVASNAGPSGVTGATVADTLPAALTGTWTCVGAGGGTCTAAGSGNINDTVNLPAGASVTYTVSATISPAATGTLSNIATVSSAVADPNPANNSATDSDTLTSLADLSITKTDGVTTVNPGASLTYTIVASNAGPSHAPGTVVADTLPATLTGATWTCVGAGGGTCTAAGSGNLNDTVNLPAGGSVTYTLTATVSGAATGTLSNTATVAAAGGITDPTPGNNSATDSDTVTPRADLSITKTDGVTTVTPGGSVTYTIVASNAGPSHAPGTVVADTLPATLTGATWTCVGAGGGTCTASGSGNLNDTVNLPAGGSVTYTLTATVSGAATGTLSNTATVTAAGGITDPTPGNNSATDTDTLTPQADLSITVTDSPDPVNAGSNLTYTVTVVNSGPGAATTASWSNTLPSATTFVSLGAAAGWSCTTPAVGGVGTVTCNKPSVAMGSSVFTLVVAVPPPTQVGTVIANTTTVTATTPDPNLANNTVTVNTMVIASLTRPDAPSIVGITAGRTQVVVDVQAPANTGGGPIVQYSVACEGGAGGATSPFSAAGSSTTATVVVPNMRPGTAYTCTATVSNARFTSLPSAPMSGPLALSMDITPILMLMLGD